MDAVLECCAGLDVHQETVVACVLFGPLEHKPKMETKTFGTTTPELLILADWLEEKKCSHVAMESTGIYWRPVWNILETGSFQLVLANAQRIKNVPGRKTDVKDAEWIAQLLRSGLIEGSFVPPVEIRDLRDLTRYRKKLLQDSTQEKNRIHKVLQDANIKITTYISDIFGISGRNIMESLIDGEVITAEKLNKMVKGKVKSKVPGLVDALNNRLRSHHREMIRYSWEHLKFLEQTIHNVEMRIDQCLRPYQQDIELLDSIPGINSTASAIMIAEFGTDMSVFPTDNHISSWAGVSPGNNESAGKKKNWGHIGKQSVKVSTMRMCVGSFQDKRYSVIRDVLAMGKAYGKEKGVVSSRTFNSSDCLQDITYQRPIQGIRTEISGRTRTGKGTTDNSATAVKGLSSFESGLSRVY